MVKGRLIRAGFSLRLVTLSLPICAFLLAAYFRFSLGKAYLRTEPVNVSAYLGLLFVATIVWGAVVQYYRLCDIDQIFAPSGKSRRTLSACLVTYLMILAAAFFYRDVNFSRLFIFLSAVLLFTFAMTTRIVFRVLLSRRVNGHGQAAKILIVGTDQFAARTAQSLQAGQVVPCKIVGFVRLPNQPVLVTDGPVRELAEIPKLALGNGFDEVVLAIPPMCFADISNLLVKLEPLCTPIRLALDFGDQVLIREKLFNFGGTLMLDLRPTPAESASYLVKKRIFDVLFSVVALIFSAPLMAIIWIALKLSSAGPAIFKQERVGLNGRPFQIYKFRTMRTIENTDGDTRWTTPNDPHRTKIGKILRRTNLDELPQFVNVLKGDMSVVGPRPERPYFVQKFIQHIASYNKRHALKVGMTGWAQVNGWRGDTSIDKRIEYDLYYLRNWSITFDLQIIVLTIIRGFFQRNAY